MVAMLSKDANERVSRLATANALVAFSAIVRNVRKVELDVETVTGPGDCSRQIHHVREAAGDDLEDCCKPS